jgi:PAP2 superfamily
VINDGSRHLAIKNNRPVRHRGPGALISPFTDDGKEEQSRERPDRRRCAAPSVPHPGRCGDHLALPRRDKFGLAVQAIVALVIAVVLIQLAAVTHADPRPFVVDPSIRPLFPHLADNGFPSDHTTLAATVAFLVMIYRWWLGAVLLDASALVGVTTAAWAWVRPRLTGRLAELAPA